MVTFSPRKQQDPSFKLELAKLSSLVADMQALQRGRMPEELAGEEAPCSIAGFSARGWPRA